MLGHRVDTPGSAGVKACPMLPSLAPLKDSVITVHWMSIISLFRSHCKRLRELTKAKAGSQTERQGRNFPAYITRKRGGEARKLQCTSLVPLDRELRVSYPASPRGSQHKGAM